MTDVDASKAPAETTPKLSFLLHQVHLSGTTKSWSWSTINTTFFTVISSMVTSEAPKKKKKKKKKTNNNHMTIQNHPFICRPVFVECLVVKHLYWLSYALFIFPSLTDSCFRLTPLPLLVLSRVVFRRQLSSSVAATPSSSASVRVIFAM